MDLQAIADDIVRDLSPRLGEGKVADYIPELAKVDPKQLGIAITTVDGTTYRAGDAETAFSVQSISKVFMLTLALGNCLRPRAAHPSIVLRCDICMHAHKCV